MRCIGTIIGLLSLFIAGGASATPSGPPIAIVGATLVDVSRQGHSERDISDSVVLLRDGLILAVGREGHLRIPADAQAIDAHGRYLVPGLIDGFGAMRSQAYADAYLQQGVTTVYVPLAPPGGGIDGEAMLVEPANGPSVLTGAPISGYTTDGSVPAQHPWLAHRHDDRPLSAAALSDLVERAANAGHRGITVGYDVLSEQLPVLVRTAHRRHLVVIAEPAFANYAQALDAGVDAFLRNDKYQLSLAGAGPWTDYAADPIGAGGRAAFKAICGGGDIDAAIDRFGSQLARAGAGLMPALAMEATADDVGGGNPWRTPAAIFFKPADLDDPVDPATGARPYLDGHAQRRDAIRACALRKQEIDRRLHARGATYLAGSSAPSYGVMPGGGVHLEVQLLQHIGLTPREALAAATGNYRERFGWRDRGAILPGTRADLLLLAADPRRDSAALETIAQVVAGGRFVARDPRLPAVPAAQPVAATGAP